MYVYFLSLYTYLYLYLSLYIYRNVLYNFMAVAGLTLEDISYIVLNIFVSLSICLSTCPYYLGLYL